jgi:hypothetical protein
MNKMICIVIVGIAVLLVGCPSRSLHPLFSEKDLVFNPSLIGTWVEKDASCTFEKYTDNSYKVTYIELKSDDQKGSGRRVDTAKYIAHLGKIGKHFFLDSYLAEKEGDHHLLPTHLFWRISLQGETLHLAALESDWLKKMIDTRRLKISHVIRDSDVVLTATTADLQRLFLRHSGDDEAFPNPGSFVRSK